MLRAEYEEARLEVQKRIAAAQEELKALETVWRLIGQATPYKEKAITQRVIAPRQKGVTQAARECIALMPTFSSKELKAAMAARGFEANKGFAQMMASFIENGTVKRTSEGRPGAPATYERVQAQAIQNGVVVNG